MSPKPLPLATASYPILGGVDSKAHGLTLPPPKLQECVNAFSDQSGSLQRRIGRTALPADDVTGTVSTSDWHGTGLHRGRLLGYTPLTAHEFSEEDQRWASKGTYVPWHVSHQGYNPSGSPTPGAYPLQFDVAALPGYRCFVYDYFDEWGGNRTVTAFTIVDDEGTRFGPIELANSAGHSVSAIRVVAFGPRFYIVYNNHQSPNNLMSIVVDTSTSITLAAGLNSTPLVIDAVGKTSGNRAVLDLQVDPVNGPLVVYKSFTSATTIKHAFLNTVGALVTASSFATGLPPTTVGAAAASDGFRHAFTWTEDTASADGYAALRTFTAGVWGAAIFTTAIASFAAVVIHMSLRSIYESDDQTLRVFWDDVESANSIFLTQATIDSTGLITTGDTLYNSSMASEPFRIDGQIYFWCRAFVGQTSSQIQSQLYLMRSDHELFGDGRGVGMVLERRPWNLPHVVQVGAEFTTVGSYFFYPLPEHFGRVITVETDPPHSLVSIEDGQTTILPGGFMQQYDGTSFVELGFLTYPEIGGATEGIGGSLTVGKYGYRVVLEWINAMGEREQSTDGGAITGTVVAAAGASMSIIIICHPWTRRNGNPRGPAKFVIYRTLVNPTAESPHHWVGSILNDPAAPFVTFVDTMGDGTAAQMPLFYADTELDHIAPGAGSIVANGNGRVFVAGIPSDPNLIQYSKQRSHGQALAFNDGLTIQVPESTGVITGLAVFAESLVVFTETAVYRVNGDGTNNTGTGGGFTPPVLVQSDSGALGQRSICVTPGGILFESPKGVMLMQANFSVTYVGAPLEKLAEPGAPMGTTMIPANQQVRFTYAEITHVFDYFHGQWYTFTHGCVGPTSLWREKLASPTAGSVQVDDAAVWTDDSVSYGVRIRLGWMHGPSLRSNLSVRKLAITGQALANVNLTLQLAKDQQAVNQTVETDFVPGRLMLETRVRKQVCSHLEVTIQDSTLGGAIQDTAGFRLNEVTFELALRDQFLGREA